MYVTFIMVVHAPLPTPHGMLATDAFCSTLLNYFDGRPIKIQYHSLPNNVSELGDGARYNAHRLSNRQSLF